MKNIFAHIKDVMIIFGLIGGAYAGYIWIQDKGAESKEMEFKTFDTVEQKVNVIQHEEQYRNNYDVMKLYDKMDSVATTQNKRDKWRDSMIMKMAVTQYQTKRFADSVNTYWKKYNASVENE